MTRFDTYLISNESELMGHYGRPEPVRAPQRSDRIDIFGRGIIGLSPFLLLSTCGETGPDYAAQGGPAGFVAVHGDDILLVPDRHGDPAQTTLRNMLVRPDVSILFFVPGMDGAYAVKGAARISVDPGLKNRFVIENERPRSVIILKVRETMVHPGYALSRSRLWTTAMPKGLPTFDELLSLTEIPDHSTK